MRICVYGAGSIGCYVGGRLAAGGAEVVFVGRERMAAEATTHGLRLTDWQGADLRVPADRVRFETGPAAAEGAGLVLVCVKSAATARAAAELAEVTGPDTVLVSFQNGMRNTEVLRAGLPGRTVVPGMVEFNVVARGEGAFHAGTEGGLAVERTAGLAAYLTGFEDAGLPLQQYDDMRPVQWAKLLLNLNNPVNALSGLPLRAELSQRGYRRCLALAQTETLGLLAAAGIQPARLTPLPPRWMPRLLGVPDPVFARVARRMLAIDPHARTSMLDDLDAGRRTEIDHLNGEVVRLAETLGRTAPINARLVALIRAAEAGGRRHYPAPELLANLTSTPDPA